MHREKRNSYEGKKRIFPLIEHLHHMQNKIIIIIINAQFYTVVYKFVKLMQFYMVIIVLYIITLSLSLSLTQDNNKQRI